MLGSFIKVLRRLAWIISCSSMLRDIIDVRIDSSDEGIYDDKHHNDGIHNDSISYHKLDKNYNDINNADNNVASDADGDHDDVDHHDVDHDDVVGDKKLILFHRYPITMIELHRIINGGNILFKTNDNNDDDNIDNNHNNDNDENNNIDDENIDDKTLYNCINIINTTGIILQTYLQKFYNNYYFIL